jgi:hypothetical protein
MDLIERDIGQLPVSIGTSLAFEGILGIHPNPPKQPTDTKSVREIWVNLRTLARNLHSAMTTENSAKLNLDNAVEVLLDETRVLPVAFTQMGGKARIRYYIASKDAIKWRFPKANHKVARTPKQMAYEFYERYVSIELLNRMKAEQIPVMEFDTKPEPADGTVALLTHFPHELLWKIHFTRLLLLESHTGKLKTYNTWYTKLNGITEETPMPFTDYTIQVFGDGTVLDSQPKAIRGQLKQLAKDRRWTGITTQDKIYHDITTHGSKELKDSYALLR